MEVAVEYLRYYPRIFLRTRRGKTADITASLRVEIKNQDLPITKRSGTLRTMIMVPTVSLKQIVLNI
jgi:hypothetical protein